MTTTVYLILTWRGDCWRPVESEADRTDYHFKPSTIRRDAEKALALLQAGTDDPNQFMIWEARGYPKEGPST